MSSNKNLLWALGATAAVVGAAVVFHFLSNKETAGNSGLNDALNEIASLGEPRREANGLMAFDYYKNVFFIIMKHARLSFAEEKAKLMKQRRELLKAKKTDEYRTLVSEMIQKEERVGTDLLQEAMEHIGLSEQEFMQTHQFYMMNPQTQQILMQAQMAAPTSNAPPKLSKAKVKEIFFDSEEKKFESMKALMKNQRPGQMGHQDDQNEALVEMMVQQAILSDEMFETHGIEEEEFNSAVMFYNLMNDPEVHRKMMESMQKLSQMGGMAGMGMM